MKIGKKLKNLAAIAMAGTMFLPVGVHAEGELPVVDNTSGTIDPARTGSITIYSFLDNDGKSVDANGLPVTNAAGSQDILGLIRDKVGNDSILPEKNSTFKLLKVADIDQVTENAKSGQSITGTYYTNIDQGFFEIMNKYLTNTGNGVMTASKQTMATDGRSSAADTSEPADHYESDDLNAWILDVNRAPGNDNDVTGESALNRYIRTHAEDGTNCRTFAPTDDNGYAKLDNLPLGLYLVANVDYTHSALSKHENYWEVVDDGDSTDAIRSAKGNTEDAGNYTDNQAGGADAGGSDYADIASPVSPFLVSVPMTNIDNIEGHTQGTAWQYDITVYPKSGSINVHKDIVTNNYSNKNVPDADQAKWNDNGTGDTVLRNDGWDNSKNETPCDMKQTNYDSDSQFAYDISVPHDTHTYTNSKQEKTSLDGSEKVGLTHQIDANIGDTITQVISSDVPVLVDDIDDEFTGANRNNAFRKHNKTYKITDRMTRGLKLIDHASFKVTLGPQAWDGGNTLLAEGIDYTLTFAQDKQSFVITMLPEGLKKMDDLTSTSYLYVLYDCEVTKDAFIGTDTYGTQKVIAKDSDGDASITGGPSEDYKSVYDQTKIGQSQTDSKDAGTAGTLTVSHPEAGNQNTAQLTYATDRTQEHDYYSNTTKVFTYEVDLTKLFTNGTQGYVSKDKSYNGKTSFDYHDVEFTIDGTVNPQSEDAHYFTKNYPNNWDITADSQPYESLLFIEVDDGVYRVYDPWTDVADRQGQTKAYWTADASNKLTNAELVQRYGEYNAADDTIDTPQQITKYVHPSSTGLLKIQGLDARKYRFTEVKTAKGRNLMAEPFYVEIEAPLTSANNASHKTDLEDGTVAHAYVYTGSRPADADLPKYDLINAVDSVKNMLNIGRVPLTVQNNEVIKVLKTGGSGTMVFAAAGAGMVAAALFLILKKKKKEEAGSEA